MPKKNRKSVEPVSLASAPAHFHPRDSKDFVASVEEKLRTKSLVIPAKGSEAEKRHKLVAVCTAREHAKAASGEAVWADIQQGKLILVGYSDRGDGNLVQVPRHILEDPGRSISFPKGQVSGSGLRFLNVGVLKPSEAKTVPEFCGAKEERPERPEPSKVSKGTPGRKPKWDWVGAERDLVTVANPIDGLPYPQAAIEKHIRAWFLQHYADEPQKSEIRKFLINRLPVNYRNSE